MWKTHRIFWFLAIVLLVVGCNGKEQNNDVIDVTQIVDAAAGKLDATTSFQLVLSTEGIPRELDVSSLGISTPLIFQRAEGVFTTPDRLQATVTVLFGSAGTEINIIVVGEKQYVSNQFITANQWRAETFSPGFNPSSLISVDAGIAAALRSLKDAQYIGQEDLDGIKVHHITGTIDAAMAQSVTVGLIGTDTGTIPVELFIRSGDGLLELIKLHEPITDGTTDWSVGIYGYDGEYTITEPEVTQ